MSVSAAEMDRRIRDLAKRQGIGGELTVRHTTPSASASEQARAAAAVLAAMAGGRPAAVSYLAHATGLTRPTVANTLSALEADGRVVQAGTEIEAAGRRRRLWVLAGARK